MPWYFIGCKRLRACPSKHWLGKDFISMIVLQLKVYQAPYPLEDLPASSSGTNLEGAICMWHDRTSESSHPLIELPKEKEP